MQAEVYVATAYGESVMEPLPGIHLHAGRLSVDEMAACIRAPDIPAPDGQTTPLMADTLVIDATHPYAVEVTANIRTACDRTGATYLRLTRPALPVDEGASVTTVPDTAAAVAWLNAQPTDRVILLTTGSKELVAYTRVQAYQKRVYLRVLPTAAVLHCCEQCGFPNAHIIAMQGPFSRGLNAALLRQTGATILVTKDTGSAGGFVEKLAAAREVGAQVLVIARPQDAPGQTLEQIQAYLAARLGLSPPHRFPLFVSLQDRLCLVFGAGTIAARRVSVLRQFGAWVRVIAPETRTGQMPNPPAGQMPGTPAGRMPETPVEQMPGTPAGRMPGTPAGRMPETPVEQMPETPAGQMPETSVEQMPGTPAGQMPETLAGRMPGTPAGRIPEPPAEQMPENSAERIPNTSAGRIPETQSSWPEGKPLLLPDERRAYRESDIADTPGVFLVVAATDQREINRQIGEACRKRGIPCSVADSAAESTFYFPAICQDGDLIAGVVSRGSSHQQTAQAAKRIRAVLHEFNQEENQ